MKKIITTLAVLIALTFAKPARAETPDPLACGYVAGVAFLAYHAKTDGSMNRGWDWTTRDIVAEALTQGLLLLDWSTTLDIKNRRSDGIYETNVFLGKHPTNWDVNYYMGSMMLLHLAVSAALPNPWRGVWQATWIGIEAGAVANNVSIGLQFKLP